MRLYLWSFLLTLFFCSSALAQDTAKVAAPKPQVPTHLAYVNESDVDPLYTSEKTIDSSLAYFHRTRGYLYDITLEKNIFKEEVPLQKHVINFSDDITLPYKFSDRTIRYYKLNKRFTEITYLFGPKKEQLLNIAYTQNLLKGWNIGLDFRRTGADGPFKREAFFQSSFDVFTHYVSPNERYNLYAYYFRNRLEQEENGGVKDFDPGENTVAQPTYLSSAENNQTDRELLLRQSFRLLQYRTDSLSHRKPQLTAGYKVRYETRGNTYLDNPIDSFYANNYLSDISTLDSTWYQRWNNELLLEYNADTSGALSLSLSGGHEYFIYEYGTDALEFFGQKENYYSCGAVNWNKDKNYLDGKIRMYFGDYNMDYDASLYYSRIFLKDQWKFFIGGNKSKAHPNITDQRRYSNHFIWFNDFSPVNSQSAEAGIATSDKKFLLSGSYYGFDNMIYYDPLAIPRQLSEPVSYYKLKLQKNFTWRHWIFDNIIEYQKADNENIIHLPDWMTGHALAYESYFFRSALFTRIGIDARYVSSYYADRYMPALQEFYLQYDKQTGGYVWADLFITFRVKSARFFIKLEDIFNGLSSEPQFSRPDYPLPPRALHFGMQVRFYD